MEIIPEIRMDGQVVHVLGPVERREAHSGEKRWHPTTQLLVTDGERFALVDKYPKDLKKSQLYGYTAPREAIRLDIFGGHLQWEQLTEEDRQGGISDETFCACALEELSEELWVDGAPCVPEPAKLRYLGTAVLPKEREVSAVYLYRLEPGQAVAGQDDAALPEGGRIQIPLTARWLGRAQIQAMYDAQNADQPLTLEERPAELCSGIMAAWTVFLAQKN